MMPKAKTFKCFIVGEDNLTIECMEILLKAEHKILGIFSSSKQIKIWCANHSIPYIDSLENFEIQCKNQSFDYLFSIINNQILPPTVLNFPRYYSINYHNSPLPKYAGLNATTWAILNGESYHGISWHIMEEGIDTGAILKQPIFPIDAEETALSLNIKCYEHAVSSFKKLIDELVTTTLVPIQQNLMNRSYFGLNNTPQNLGFIDWHQPAQQIDVLCRALTLGRHTNNQLTTPKIIIKNTIYVVKQHAQLTSSSGLIPGNIAACSPTYLQIATLTNDILLYSLTDLQGKDVSLKTLITRYGLSKNVSLDSINPNLLAKLQANPSQHSKIETFWVREFFKTIHETSLLSQFPKKEGSSQLKQLPTIIPEALHHRLRQNYPEAPFVIFLTISLLYFYRLNNYKNLSLTFSNDSLSKNSTESKQFFSHQLPLTTDFNSSMTFKEALQIVFANYTSLINHHTYSTDIFIRYPELSTIPEIELGIIIVNKEFDSPHFSDKPLTLYLREDCSGFFVQPNIHSNFRTISSTFLEQMNTHLLILLEDALNYPDKTIAELSILNEKEKNTLLVEWNKTQVTFDEKKPLHYYFEEQVLKTPNAIAAVFGESKLTYEQLNQRSNQIAFYLKNQGIQPNHIVGICLNRGLELITSILGILKSGAAYLPLDANYPSERLSYMLSDSQCHFLIMDSGTIKNKPKDYKTNFLEVNTLLNDKTYFENLKCVNRSTDLAYVIYTSGTTGNPKGVAISHKAICNHMLWMQQQYSFNSSDNFLQKTSVSFDASVWEFFMPLLLGGRLIIAPNYAYANPSELIRLIQHHQISVLQVVPSLLKELLTVKDFKCCNSLNHVFCGGEALTATTINTFFKKKGAKTKLHNLYGPTEATIDTVTMTCTEENAKHTVSFIGKPIRNTKVYVLDQHLQLLPIGITGELYISGTSLANGYIHNPQATSEKFLKNPFNGNSCEEKLYKTGDLVKWNNNGLLEYHGRSDTQVKIRGYRIELNEVEVALSKIPFIRECIVITEIDSIGLLSLSAYLVLNPDIQFYAKDIRSYLEAILPEYMIPNRFYVVNSLLKTPGGKLDRVNIPKPLKLLPTKHLVRQAITPLQITLKKLWSSTLNIDEFGIDDDFFNLGGNSLSAMRIISFLKNSVEDSLSISAIFEFSTIATLAQEIERIQHNISQGLSNNSVASNTLIPIKTTGNKKPLFLIHPIGGSVFWYKRLGQYLDPNQPLYGIQDPGLEQQELLFNSLEDMAQNYVHAIQTIQPQGPYLLGGASFGSTVAVEVTKQLQESGQIVNAIFSLDGWAYYPSLQKNEIYFQKIMKEQNERLLKTYLENHINGAKFLLQLQWHREKMLTNYKLPMIQTKFILFKAKILNEIFSYHADFNWWESYSETPIELHVVPGDHESMFSEPHIQVLAQEINQALYQHQFDLSILDDEKNNFSLQANKIDI